MSKIDSAYFIEFAEHGDEHHRARREDRQHQRQHAPDDPAAEHPV